MSSRVVVVRIRGSVNVNKKLESTLGLLRLKKVNNAVIIDDRPNYKGMLQIVKDYVTWGEVDQDDVSLILKNRGELSGNEKLTDEFVKKNTSFKSINDFSGAYAEFKAELTDIPGLKPTFRLHPPRKGYKGIKKAFSMGGSLGNRKNSIKDLIYKMR
jgi:large subunit ribosomal protein L30